jgi:hypothetical protein
MSEEVLPKEGGENSLSDPCCFRRVVLDESHQAKTDTSENPAGVILNFVVTRNSNRNTGDDGERSDGEGEREGRYTGLNGRLSSYSLEIDGKEVNCREGVAVSVWISDYSKR